MPRPKVHPDNRQRLAQACTQCKASKRRCNVTLPCSHCIRRGLQDACHFPAEESKGNPSAETSQEPSVVSQCNPTSETFQEPTLDFTIQSPNVSTASHGTSRGEAPNKTKPRMLSNTHGERVFVGGSASLSFLQLVRETVQKCIGTSEFTDLPNRDRMLEADLRLEAHPNGLKAFNLSTQRVCLDNYFLATNGVINILNRENALELLRSTPEKDSYRMAIKLLILAIGAQTIPLNEHDARTEKATMVQAQKIAFATMIEDPSLDMIRVFLLLSFYMLGACRRNAAFMYLGVAARAAHALGLHHTESYRALEEEKERSKARLSCWKSLVSLDLIVCSILGRAPASLPSKTVEYALDDNALATNTATFPELDASYQLAILVDGIVNDFYAPKSMTVEAAESHLLQLRSWSEALPAQLRLSGSQARSKHARESLLGSLQISCFYYFAVMLITRPFLIAHLTSGLVNPPGETAVPQSASDSQDVFDMANACVNAAVFMAQTCADVLDLNSLLENMCLLKAWTFAAGLVLGFQSFASKDVDDEVEHAFKSTCNVLKKFSGRSPQAAHYHDILIHLSAAILKQRQIMKSRKRKRAVSFVDRIVNLRPEPTERSAPTLQTDTGQSHLSISEEQVFDIDAPMNLEFDPQLSQTSLNHASFGWDSSFLFLDDQFSIDPQNLGGVTWNFPWRHIFTEGSGS